MRSLIRAAVPVLACAVCVAPGLASNLDNAVFALHVQAHASKSSEICTTANPIDTTTSPAIACSEFTVEWPIFLPADVYVVVARVDSGGIGGVTFGIGYNGADIGDGIDIVAWTVCASGSESPSQGWPGPGTGNTITWLQPDECAQQFVGSEGIHGVVGSLYIYAYGDDRLQIREHPPLKELAVSNCAGAIKIFDYLEPGFLLYRLGRIGFGQAAVSNPCMWDVPVRRTTWGEIKSTYGAP